MTECGSPERVVVVLSWASSDEAAHAGYSHLSQSVSLHADACLCVHTLQQLAAVLHGLMMPSECGMFCTLRRCWEGFI